MALNTGINSLNKGAPDIKYTGTEGPQDPRMASAYLGDKYMGMQDLVDEFKQRHGYDPMHDIDQWKKFLDMKRQDPEARLQERDTRTASAPNGEPFMMEEFLQAVKEGFKGDYDAFIDQIDKSPADYMAQGGIAGTYTQRRRNQMAGGGIMGSNAGSMLVAPTADGSRPGYGWLDKLADLIPNELKDPVTTAYDKLIPNELKNPAVAAIAANYLPTAFGSPTVLGQLGEKFPTILGPTSPIGKGIETVKGIPGSIMEAFTGGPNVVDEELERVVGRQFDPDDPIGYGTDPEGGIDWGKALATVLPFGDPGYVEGGLYNKLLGLNQPQQIGPDGKPIRSVNWQLPMAIGAGAGLAQQKYLADQPPFPGDETGIRFQTAQQAMADPEQRFKPQEQYVLPSALAAEGGRIGAQEGGLMNLGGMEKDYRQEGGFVPLGGEEKADDVPARLSKNEFVFTADAVRNAGGGDIDRGAEVMENLMENLEAGGEISEDSQGLEGARGMFANAQKLQNRII
jgi:hypothetical protein